MPAYVKGYISNGRPYFYYRRNGAKDVRLPGLPWSPEFMEAHAKAEVAYKAPGPVEIGASRTVAGTVNAGLVVYYQSTAFSSGLSTGSQSSRRNLLERFRTEFGQVRLKSVERRHVQRYISLLKTPSVQRNMLQALKHFFKYCVDAQLIGNNSAEGVSKAKMPNTGGFYAWTEEDVKKYRERHPIGSKARLALALYLNLGVRKSDVVRIGPRDVKDGVLTDFLPQKTSRTGGKRINVPLTAETKAIIKATPITGSDTYLVTEFGKPFTANGFGNKMREWCDQAGLPECTSHGLRKLCLTRLADIEGMDVLSLAAISGHKDLRELQVYIDAADRKRRARRAIELLEKAQKQNTKVSKRTSRLDKSTVK
ncbi:tyrosine-type recombinase/integrase [Bradyrhizobium sp. UFLA05-112]